MDTSKQYITMCDCSEISKLSRTYRDSMSFWRDKDCPSYFGDPKAVFLPRQDQLQEIYCSVMINKKEVFNLVSEIFRFANTNPVSEVCKSMEQLWLAFVMNELYKKEWKEDKWI